MLLRTIDGPCFFFSLILKADFEFEELLDLLGKNLFLM